MKSPEVLLREVYSEHRADLPPVFKWTSEKARLNEFYYCLLQRMSGGNEVEVQNIVTSLASLNLFDVESLAEAQIIGGKGGKGDKIASLIADLLIQNGFEEQVARACTIAVCEAARSIQVSYDGKLQRFLRKYADLMIEELSRVCSLSNVTEQDKRYFLAHWLQNALEMPIPLSNEFVEQFCKENNIEVADIVKAADKFDINVAVVDDLLKMHMQKKEGRLEG
jgi:hypothetical protein